MIAMGFQNVVTGQWWPSVFPGVILAITVFAFSLIGSSIEVLADPVKRRELVRDLDVRDNKKLKPAKRGAAAEPGRG